MSTPDVQVPVFDVKKFYADIISFDEDMVAEGMLGLQGTQFKIGELMKRIKQKEFKKRV